MTIDLMKYFLEELYPDVKHIDLLSYHKMASGKVERLGLKQPVNEIEEPDAFILGSIRKKFEETGFIVGVGG